MEYRVDPRVLFDSFGRAFYPTAIATVVGALVAVHVYLGAAFAIFGLYALVGLVGGAGVYYGFDEVSTHADWGVDDRIHRLGVYAISVTTVGIVALTGDAFAVVVGLVIGYVLVVRQLFANPSPTQLLPQITALFLLSPLTKYLTAGRYLGHGDLVYHTGVVGDLMAGNSLEAIAYASYYDFPGLHLIASSVASLAGLEAYDGLMLTGLVIYAVLLPTVYLVVVRLTEHPLLALCTTLAVTALDDFSFFASYVFPQSLAIVLVGILALLATLASTEAIKWRIVATFGVVAIVLSYTHHLTQVVVLPLVALAIVLYASRGREYVFETLRSRQLALIAFALAVTGVRLFQTGFVDRLATNVGPVVGGGVQGGYSQVSTFGLGRPPHSNSVAGAVDWLFSPYALYLIVLLCVFSHGVVAFLRASNRPVTQTALFCCGVIGSVLIFETPISIQSLIRIRMPWLFVFAFVVAIGLLQMKRSAGPGRRSALLLAVVVVLATLAPMVTADNYYELDPRPTIETSFSESELAELEAVSGYVDSREMDVGTLWLTRKFMERDGVEDIQHVGVDDGSVILPAGHFVYRSSWPGHKVHFTVGDGSGVYANTLYVDGNWLDGRVEGTNKVYSVGGTGVVWGSTDRQL